MAGFSWRRKLPRMATMGSKLVNRPRRRRREFGIAFMDSARRGIRTSEESIMDNAWLMRANRE